MHYDLTTNISIAIEKVSNSLIRRAASFLLLSDSQASFEIEGERATKNRIENWGKIINEAGRRTLTLHEIERLHGILLDDSRFMKVGLREEEVFLGDRDRDNFPIPEFIGAKSEDLIPLIEDWIELDKILSIDGVDPILHAVIIAFSFVYIHPLEDGNGRIHRYLIHHVLAQRDFYPKGMIFPISGVILDEIQKYREILVTHTAPLMPLIQWEATERGNVKILNNTADLYRFFNCTESCEFIYKSVEKTIKETLPHELNYLNAFDKTYSAINEMIEMPDNKIKSLITFILQNSGKLSKKKKEKYYQKLTQEELEKIEDAVKEYFEI
jgi:Fic family protein